MADREKVINDLLEIERTCSTWLSDRGDRWAAICRDVLELLKAQEEEIEHLKRPDCEHAEHDGAGCLGYCGCTQDDEPIESCKDVKSIPGTFLRGGSGMIDREKVVRADETCFDSWIDKHRNMGLDLNGVKQMKRDALELLNEQKAIIEQYQKADSFLAMHGWKWEVQ